MEKEYVKGLGDVYTIEKPFDEALILLNQQNAKLISSRDLSYARRINGLNSDLSQYGSYTKEALIYSKDVGLLVLNSPLQDIGLAKKAVHANRDRSYFQFEDKELFKKYLAQAEKDLKLKKAPEERNVLILPSDNNFAISRTKNFEFARGLFKDQAELYFKFLEDSKYKINSITFFPVLKETINSLENPVITELWLYRFEYGNNGSDLLGDNRWLYYNSCVRGWLASTEGAKPKKIESELAQTKSFFEKLKQ